jgi:hypothetical protein
LRHQAIPNSRCEESPPDRQERQNNQKPPPYDGSIIYAGAMIAVSDDSTSLPIRDQQYATRQN